VSSASCSVRKRSRLRGKERGAAGVPAGSSYLALETSTPHSVIAVGSALRILARSRRVFAKGRADRLIGWIEGVLGRARLSFADIDAFGVGVGPGSFTGIRIGLSTVKGLAYALDKKIVVFSSLDAIAYGLKGVAAGPLAVAVDARRANVYCRFYDVTREGLTRRTRPALIPAKDFLRRLKKGMVVAGDAAPLLAKEIRRCGAVCASKESGCPRPEALAALTREGIARHDFVDAFHLKPEYLYEQDCQVRRD